MTYLIKQGKGQLSLEWNSIENEELLKDIAISDEDKEKIRSIEKYKKYFFDYFNKEISSIYSKTTYLKDSAVTYLVTASHSDKIKALKHKFPIVGEFPYLGFFSKEDAYEYAKQLEKDGFQTYIRDVYAYSTLNQWIFTDNILSSFFHLGEKELAELIFHELFHTIFFVKNEILLNENLAQFFARKLRVEYFSESEEDFKREKKNSYKRKVLYSEIKSLANELNSLYKSSNKDPVEVKEKFIHNVFKPKIKIICNDLQLTSCWPLKGKWNNARFLAFLTYESKQDELYSFYTERFNDLKSFFLYLERIHKKFNKKNREETFKSFFMRKIK